MEVKSTVKTLAVLVIGLILGAAGFYLMEKYVFEKKEENVEKNDSLATPKTETKDEIDINEVVNKISNLANGNSSSIEKEWKLNKKIVLKSFGDNSYYFDVNYVLSGVDLKPILSEGKDGGLEETFINQNYQELSSKIFNNFDLHTMLGSANDKYLVVCGKHTSSVSPICNIYNSEGVNLGDLKISQGVLMSNSSNEKSLLSEYSGLESDSGRVLVTENYMLTSYDKNDKHYIYKYTINNGKLNEELIKTYNANEALCIQCN